MAAATAPATSSTPTADWRTSRRPLAEPVGNDSASPVRRPAVLSGASATGVLLQWLGPGAALT